MIPFETWMNESTLSHFHRLHPGKDVEAGDIIPGPNGKWYKVIEVLNSLDDRDRVPLT